MSSFHTSHHQQQTCNHVNSSFPATDPHNSLNQQNKPQKVGTTAGLSRRRLDFPLPSHPPSFSSSSSPLSSVSASSSSVSASSSSSSSSSSATSPIRNTINDPRSHLYNQRHSPRAPRPPPNRSRQLNDHHPTLDPNKYISMPPSLPPLPLKSTTVNQRASSSPSLIQTSPRHSSEQSTLNFPKSMKRKNFKKLSLGPEVSITSNSSPSISTNNQLLPTSLSSTLVSSYSSADLSSRSNHGAANNSSSSDSAHTSQTEIVYNPESELLISRMSTLNFNADNRTELQDKDFKVIRDLGSGNGGTVAMVEHVSTHRVMARKRIPIEPKLLDRIKNELVIMHEVNSPYIVGFYGYYISGNVVVMCLEYMDKGSLDRISKKSGPLLEPIIGKITEAVVEGLDYLYSRHRIMHRDIKPSNVLVNSQGQIKLCDFGVSSELVNSMAETFVGTSVYMSPERIQGGKYTVRSDVWSVGITLLELALGHSPWDDEDIDIEGNDGEKGKEKSFGIIDLLQKIIYEAPPSLPKHSAYSQEFKEFVDKCLLKEEGRPTPAELKKAPFFVTSKSNVVRLDLWARQL